MPIESVLIQELIAQARQDTIMALVEARFGQWPPELTLALRTILDEDKLRGLVRLSAACPDLAAFQERLGSLTR